MKSGNTAAIDWANVPFIDYSNAVDDILKRIYGIEVNDIEMADVAAAQEDGWTPEFLVKVIGKEHDLTPIHEHA